MIAKLAKSTAHFFSANRIIPSEDEEVYAYGMELLYSTISNIVISLILGIITDTLFEIFLFLSSFILLRDCIGGYHAKTHLGCMSIFCTVLIGFILIVKFMPDFLCIVFFIGSNLLSALVAFVFAPIEHPNKPLTEIEKAKLCKRGKSTYVVLLSISLILLCSGFGYRYSIYISLGMLVSSAAMLCQFKVNNRTGKRCA